GGENYRRLPAVPASGRRDRRIHLFAAGGDDLFASGFAGGFDDVHPSARVLPAETEISTASSSERISRNGPMAEAALAIALDTDSAQVDFHTTRRRAQKGLCGVLLPCRQRGHQPPLEVPGRIAGLSGARRIFCESAQAVILPEGPVLSLLCGRVAAGRRAARRDGRGRPSRRRSDPPRGQKIRRGAQKPRRAAIADDVHRRWRPTLLVLGRARIAATQLRADNYTGQGQTRYRTSDRAAAENLVGGDRWSAH